MRTYICTITGCTTEMLYPHATCLDCKDWQARNEANARQALAAMRQARAETLDSQDWMRPGR